MFKLTYVVHSARAELAKELLGPERLEVVDEEGP